MFSRAVKYAKRRLSDLRARKSHPWIRRSSVARYDLVSPFARVNDSRIVAPVIVKAGAVLDRCLMIGKASISIGERSAFTGPVLVRAEVNPIAVGKYCSIASNVSILEANHHIRRASTYYMNNFLFGDLDYRSDLRSKGPIEIGHDVWVGVHVVILSGVTIGHGAVIGAGSVVSSNVPPYAIAAGSPAKVIGHRFPEEVSRKLLDLNWWDWDEEKIKRNRRFFQRDLTVEMFSEIVD